MRRKGAHRIDSLLDQFVKANNLEQGLAEYRITKGWYEILGHNIGAATKSIYLKDEKLFVKLHSSVIRNELTLLKEEIIRRLNEYAGMEVIRDLVLR